MLIYPLPKPTKLHGDEGIDPGMFAITEEKPPQTELQLLQLLAINTHTKADTQHGSAVVISVALSF